MFTKIIFGAVNIIHRPFFVTDKIARIIRNSRTDAANCPFFYKVGVFSRISVGFHELLDIASCFIQQSRRTADGRFRRIARLGLGNGIAEFSPKRFISLSIELGNQLFDNSVFLIIAVKILFKAFDKRQ